MLKYNLPLTNTLYIKSLKSYLLLADDNLKLLKDQNDEFTKRMIRNESGDDWLDESSHLNNIDWLLLNSIFIAMYASFEFFLMKVVSSLEMQVGDHIKLKHITGRGLLEHYTNYLYLIGGIKSAKRENAVWSRITHYQSIRNLLAHNGGIMLEDDDKKLEKHKDFKFLQQEDVYMLSSIGIIRIGNKKILQSFVNDTTFLTEKLLKEFNRKYFDRKKF